MIEKVLVILIHIWLIFILTFAGAWGGQWNHWPRRFFFPGIMMLLAFIYIHSPWVLTVYIMSVWLSLGYGIPDDDYKTNPSADRGSALGMFFYKLFNNSKLLANIFTRGTVGLLISSSMLSIPILKEKWVSFLVGSAITILVWAIVAWRGFGEKRVILFGKEFHFLKVDLVVYGITSFGLITIIYGFLK